MTFSSRFLLGPKVMSVDFFPFALRTLPLGSSSSIFTDWL